MKNTAFRAMLSILFVSLLFSQISFAQTIGKPKKTLALVVGISDYQYEGDLKYADKDAEDFAKYLTSKDGYKIPKSNIKMLVNQEATRKNIMYDGLIWLSEELNPGDEAFIFYSGHGKVRDLDAVESGFLLTYETQKDMFELTALPMDHFLKQVSNLSLKKKAVIRVILDVCHSGVGTMRGGIYTLIEDNRDYDPQKLIMITSSKPDQVSWEFDRLKNGVFTYFFMEGLKGKANIDGDLDNITLMEIMAYAQREVDRYVQARKNKSQSPDFKGDFNHKLGKYSAAQLALEAIQGNSGDVKGGGDEPVELDPEVQKVLRELAYRKNSTEKIESAYALYLEQPEETPEDKEAKRKMKRELVAIMTDKADKALSIYFDQEGSLMKNPNFHPASDYYLKSAKLLGKDHLMHDELLAKYFFMEALKLNSNQPNDPKVLDKLNSSLTLNPNASYTLNEIGNVYFAKKEYKKARAYYEKATDISPAWGKNIIKTIKEQDKNKLADSGAIPKSYGMTTKRTVKSPAKPEKIENPVYRIQLAAASDVHRDQFKKVEDLGPVNPEFDPKKELMSTWMGPFENKEEASSILAKVKQRGFRDAYLVEAPRETSYLKKLEEKVVKIEKEKAAAMPFQIRIAAVSQFNESDYSRLKNIGTVETEALNVKGKKVYRVLIRSNFEDEAKDILQKVKQAGFKEAYLYTNHTRSAKPKIYSRNSSAAQEMDSGKYKIRLAVVSKLVDGQFAQIEHLGKVSFEVIPEKDLIRAYLGNYPTKTKANQALARVKKLGYKDAYVEYDQ